MTETQLRDQMLAFRRSVARDLYAVTDIVDFASAKAAVDRVSAEISELEKALNEGLTEQNLAATLDQAPMSYAVICSILSINSEIELEDGRVLPAPSAPPRGPVATLACSAILLELGVAQLLPPGTDLRRILMIQQTGTDAGKRRNRVDQKMQRRVAQAIDDAIAAVNATTDWALERVSENTLPLKARQIVDHVISVNGEPRIAVAATFQAYSGGRQSRDMSTLYPNLQSTLRAADISLILIADGKGMRSISDRALREAFTSVSSVMSIKQAEAGGLVAAFSQFAAPPAEPALDADGARKLIANRLAQARSVTAAFLPLPKPQARLALASYASANERLSLELAQEGESLAWVRGEIVDALRNLANSFVSSSALAQASRLLEIHFVPYNSLLPDLEVGIGTVEDDPLFPAPFVVGATAGAATVSTVREFAKAALQGAPEAQSALLVVSQPLTASRIAELRRTQPLLPVNVIVLDLPTAIEMALLRGNPRDRLRSMALEQSDLTRISPFVVRSVTPEKAFFGREEEENLLQSTLATNSVALLGGRRIGKTSLMKFAERRLMQNGFLPYFADCQVVKTWKNFGALAHREWNVDVPAEFRPNDLFGVVKSLKGGSDKPLIILLDEIDQLLHWDKSHDDDEVPEAFFRACRAISQQGLAQFVFSGERTIATTMWDATSPHWNFCRPLMLQQLTRLAANNLIANPLLNLGVRLSKRDELLQRCWDATDGHPELLQYLGDKIVGRINDRDREDVYADAEDVEQIANTYEYAEQYLETYWGQSSPSERIISLIFVSGPKTVQDVANNMHQNGLDSDIGRLQDALRMLELYGIIEKAASGYQLKALWFTRALEFYGGIEATASRYREAMQKQ